MKRTFSLLLVLLVLFSLSAATKKEVSFASFKATTLEGESVDAAVFKGHKVTMVNIWGTFCSPCIREMPDLGELHRKYAEKGFQIIGIVSDVNASRIPSNVKKLEKAKAIIEETGADYLHLIPSTSLNDIILKDVYAIPHTVFVDEDGTVLGEAYSGARSKEAWETIILALLEGR